jgi:hypothetical protein
MKTLVSLVYPTWGGASSRFAASGRRIRAAGVDAELPVLLHAIAQMSRQQSLAQQTVVDRDGIGVVARPVAADRVLERYEVVVECRLDE